MNLIDVDCKVNIVFVRNDDGSCSIGDMTIIPDKQYEGPDDIEFLIAHSKQACITLYPFKDHYPSLTKGFDDIVAWSKEHACCIRSKS